MRYLDGSGVRVSLVELHPGRVSVVFRVPGWDRGATPLTLIGHTDVVGVDEAGWSRDPFGGEVVDGADGRATTYRYRDEVIDVTQSGISR